MLYELLHCYYYYHFRFVTMYDDAGICIAKVQATSHSLGALIFHCLQPMLQYLPSGFSRLLESGIFFCKISRIWKVLENDLGLRKSCKFELKVCKVLEFARMQ